MLSALDSTDQDFLGAWLISHYYEPDLKLSPSCLYNTLDFYFTQTDTTRAQGYTGVNRIAFEFGHIAEDSLMLPDTVIIETNDPSTPYAHHVEVKLIEFLQSEDSLKYDISGNVMNLSTLDGSKGIQFFVPL